MSDKTRASMSLTVEFEGVCHPPAESNDYDGSNLTQEDMQEKTRTLAGTPVLVDHGRESIKKQIGQVTSAHVDDQNRLIVKGEIDRSTWDGIETVNNIRGGKLPSLSLGVKYKGLKVPSLHFAKVLVKDIHEVSVTGCPEHDDTDIQHIQDDTQHWKVTKNLMHGKLKQYKLKTQLYKAENDMKELLRGLARTSLPKNPSDTMASNAEAPATPAVPAPPAPVEPETPEGETEEDQVSTLKRKLEDLEKKNVEQLTKVHQYAELQDEILKDPLKWQTVMLNHQKREQELQGKVRDQKPLVMDMVTDLYTKQGKVVPDELKQMLDNADKNPELGYVLQEFASVAHNHGEDRQKEVEKRYQDMKTEMTTQKKSDDEKYRVLYDQWKTNSQEQKYLSQMKGTGESPHPPSSDGTQQPASKKVKQEEGTKFETRFAKPNLKGISHNIRGVDPGIGLQNPDNIDLLQALFNGGKGVMSTGMEHMNYAGLTGKQYSLPDGVNKETRELIDDRHTMRSAAPPTTL